METTNNNSWVCKHCTLKNDTYFKNCGACFIPRDEESKPSKRRSSTNPYIESAFIENLNPEPKDSENEEKEHHKGTCTPTIYGGNAWKCKICSMENNKHITYCEICLIPRQIQQDATLLKELQNKLHSNDCHHHIRADEIKGLIHKFKEDMRRLKLSDLQFSNEIQQEIDSIYTKTKRKCDGNMVQNFIKEYNIDHNNFKAQKRSNKHCHPVCKCGTEMLSMKANVYRGISHYKYVMCDICERKLNKNDTVFHCPRKQVARCHPDGFDICLRCREQYIHRLRHFVAIIICPKMTKDGSNNDSEALQLMFHRMGFHTIVCLKDDQVTKQSVENTLKALLPTDGENVNQFTVICYSGHGAMDKKTNNYYFAIDDDPNTWIASDIIKTRCESTAIGCATNGFKKYFNNFWNKTYHRHNTLLLINSCFSGGYIDSQAIATSFGSGTALAVLLAAFGLKFADIAIALRGMTSYTVMDAEVLSGLFTSGSIQFNIGSLMETFGLSPAALVAIAKIVGISLIAVIIVSFTVYKAINKSMECESIYVIASSEKNESSYACCGVSPFIQHCNDFFTIFMDSKGTMNKIGTGYEVNGSYLADSPSKLYEYLQFMYTVKEKELGEKSLNESGQTVCASKRGFHQFAMCPMLKRN